jgi:hypothetical protein
MVIKGGLGGGAEGGGRGWVFLNLIVRSNGEKWTTAEDPPEYSIYLADNTGGAAGVGIALPLLGSS